MEWPGFIVGLAVVLGLIIGGIFTAWMFLHAVVLTITMWPKRRDNALNVLLLILFFFGGFVGAVVYFFVRYLKATDFEIG